MDVILQNQLKAFRAEQELGGLSAEQLFETFAAFCTVSPLHEDHFQPERLRTGGTGDLSVDAAAVIIGGEIYTDPEDVREAIAHSREPRVHFVIVQAKLHEGFESKVFAEIADNILHIFSAPNLRQDCSVKIKNLRQCVEAVYADRPRIARRLPRLSVWYATPGRASARRLESKRADAQSRLTQSAMFSSVDVRAAGAIELRELYKSAMEALTVAVTMPKSMRVLLPDMSPIRRGVVGVVLGRELVDNVLKDQNGALRQSLFDENVRDFLSYTDNPVNQRIAETLKDDELRSRFAVLNNGVTITAREVHLVSDTVVMRGFRVVNGCQTCNVLFDHYPELDDSVYVTVKIIESDEDEILEGIVAATNQQTAISDQDLLARGKFHKTLEQYFAAHPPSARLYYERRPRQYARPTIEQTRVISRPDLTRAFASMFLNESWRVWRLKELVGARRADLFTPGSDPMPYYVSAAVLYRIDWLLRNRPALAEFRPARFALLAAVKLRILGAGDLPRGRSEREAACKAILDRVWEPDLAHALVNEVLPALRATVDGETADGTSLAAAVRTQRFGDRMRDFLLGSG